MLLIDDEADNASIDLKSRVKDKKPRKPLTDKQEEAKNKMDFPEEHWSNYDATKINASIRKIIKKFKKKPRKAVVIWFLHLDIQNEPWGIHYSVNEIIDKSLKKYIEFWIDFQ